MQANIREMMIMNLIVNHDLVTKLLIKKKKVNHDLVLVNVIEP